MSNCSPTNQRRDPRRPRFAVAAGFLFLLALPRTAPAANKIVELCKKGMRGLGSLLSFSSKADTVDTTMFVSGDVHPIEYLDAQRKLQLLAAKGVKVFVYEKKRGDYKRMLVHIEAADASLYAEARKAVSEIERLTPDAVNRDGFGGDVAAAMKSFDTRGTGKNHVSVLVSLGPLNGLREAAIAEGFLDGPARSGLLASVAQATRPTPNETTKRADKVREEMRESLGKLTDVPYGGPDRFTRPETPYLDAAAGANRDVMYFGSDTAVTDVLANYPLASTYHLVDTWGPGGAMKVTPAMKLPEIENKLAHIGPNAKVETVSRGYLASLNEADLATHDAYKAKMATLTSKPPVVLRVTWDSPSQGKQTRTFYIHHADYHDTADLKAVLATVPKGELGGVLFQGGPMTPRAGFPILMDKLAPDAAIAGSAGYYLETIADGAAVTKGSLTKYDAGRDTGFLLRRPK